MKIVVLAENNNSPAGFRPFCPGEQGLSLWIDTGSRVFLFDTGCGSLFLENMARLGLDPQVPEALILSHGHFDHAGGLEPLLKIRQRSLPLYHHRDCWIPKYSWEQNVEGEDQFHFRGIPHAEVCRRSSLLEERPLEEDVLDLGEGFFLAGNFPDAGLSAGSGINPDNPGRYRRKMNGAYPRDTFSDEIVLVHEGDRSLVVITGCAHPGIANIVEVVSRRWAKPVETLLGGWHLSGVPREQRLRVYQDLKRLGVRYPLGCHCTGAEAVKEIQKLWEVPQGVLHSGKAVEFNHD